MITQFGRRILLKSLFAFVALVACTSPSAESPTLSSVAPSKSATTPSAKESLDVDDDRSQSSDSDSSRLQLGATSLARQADKVKPTPKPSAILPSPTAYPTPTAKPLLPTPMPPPTETQTPVSGIEIVQIPGVIAPPLLIDGEKGWMFASVEVAGQDQTLKLATLDGKVLSNMGYAGRLALDRINNHLIVDQGSMGVIILDASTGALMGTVALPSATKASADPQVDPSSGLAYAFRDKTIFVIDTASKSIVKDKTLSVPTDVCGEIREDAPITKSHYDLVSNKLYLGLITYICTPWVNETIIAFSLPEIEEVGRYHTELNYHSVPFLDSLFGTTAGRLGMNINWAWNGRETWYSETNSGTVFLKGIVADWARQLLFEVQDQQITIFRPLPREVILIAELPILAESVRLVGHDPISDQLYFLVNGQLAILETSLLFE
jgi:hypothetical protein